MSERPMTLTDFLLARIADDEADARLADGVTDGVETDWQDVTQPITWATVDLGRDTWARRYGHAYQHISRHDPARVLAECEAERRLLDLFDAQDEWGNAADANLARQLLALPYADHPDYREEWKP